MLSSMLSIFLICVVAVLMGMYLRKQITGKALAVLFLLLLIPTTINETKGTLVLLPIALGTIFVLDAKPGTEIPECNAGRDIACGIRGGVYPSIRCAHCEEAISD